MSTLREEIRALASRPGGVRAGDIPGRSAGNVGKCLADMRQRGQLHKVKRGHKSVWYFANLRDAEAFEASMAKTTPGTVAGSFSKAWWGKDAEPVFTDKTIHTPCPPTKAGQHLRTDTHSIGRY